MIGTNDRYENMIEPTTDDNKPSGWTSSIIFATQYRTTTETKSMGFLTFHEFRIVTFASDLDIFKPNIRKKL